MNLPTDIEKARSQIENIRINLDRLTVRALADGQVLQLNVRLGQFAAMVEDEKGDILVGRTGHPGLLRISGDQASVETAEGAVRAVNAFVAASDKMDKLSGQAFNIGGGPSQTISLRELLHMIGRLDGRPPRTAWNGWRTGDQKYYVSDTRRFARALGQDKRLQEAHGLELLSRPSRFGTLDK